MKQIHLKVIQLQTEQKCDKRPTSAEQAIQSKNQIKSLKKFFNIAYVHSIMALL
jgi:hypothetical protein